MSLTEIFRITPEYGVNGSPVYYEHAEYTQKEGTWYMHNERYFTSEPPRYVGYLIRREEGGFGDNSWRIDFFQNEYNEVVSVPYSYEGRTCFREVPRREIPSLFEFAKKTIQREGLDYGLFTPFL